MAIITQQYVSAMGMGWTQDGKVLWQCYGQDRASRRMSLLRSRTVDAGREGCRRNQSHPRILVITLPSRGHHIASILPYCHHGHRVGMSILEPALCQQFGIAFPSCGYHIAIACPSLGHHRARAWPSCSHINRVAIRWPAQCHHNVIAWP